METMLQAGKLKEHSLKLKRRVTLTVDMKDIQLR